MQRLRKVMVYAWNSHGFGQTFRDDRYYKELRNPLLSKIWEEISEFCYCVDALVYGIHYMDKQIDWSGTDQYTTGPGVSAMICMTIEK
jgi:hypothetical protein